MEYSIITRFGTIDAINILGNIHRCSLCHLKHRLSAHKDVARTCCLEVLSDNTTVAIHLETVLISVTKVNLEEFVDSEMTIINYIITSCGIIEVIGGIMSIVHPRIVIAIDIGIAGNRHGGIVLHMTASCCMQTGSRHCAVVDDD